MNRRIRTAVGAALAAAVTLGGPVVAGATAASAAPHTKAAHSKAGHTKAGQHKKGEAAKVARVVKRTDAALTRVLRKIGALEEPFATGLAENVAQDRATLASATTLPVARSIRAEKYQLIVAHARLVSSLTATVADLTEAGVDTTEAVAALEAVTTAVLGLSATSSRAQLRAVKAQLSALEELVEELAASVPADDTGADTGEDLGAPAA